MAEAAVDLPDNLAPALATGDADALLAQMAGEQIDRMLSGVELETSASGDGVKDAFEKLETQPLHVADPIAKVAIATPIESKPEQVAVVTTVESQIKAKPNLLVTLLEVINQPFSACPDGLRDALGKIAVVTLLNAIGVLIYIRFFMHR